MKSGVRRCLAGIVAGVMGIWFLGGLAMFSDAPIHKCHSYTDYEFKDHPSSICGKQGQSHTAEDMRRFEIWQCFLTLGWPVSIVVVGLLLGPKIRKS